MTKTAITGSYIIQGNNITVVLDSKPHTISKSHITYNRVLAAVKANDWATIADIIDPKEVVIAHGKGNVSVQGDKLFWKNRELHGSLSKRIVQMIQDEFPIEPMVAFMENLMENPSKRAVNELYGFLEKNTLPITPDGCFLAYKKVNQNYKDCASGTVLNKPAVFMTDEDKVDLAKPVGKRDEVTVEIVDGFTVVSMERNMVDDDQNRTCSTGLHICSRDYLNNFGGDRIIVVKVNPKDVVSIPTDYNDSKGRVCSYTIVDEIDKDKADEAFAKSVQAAAEKEASTLTEDDRKNIAAIFQLVKAEKVKAAKEAVAEVATPSSEEAE